MNLVSTNSLANSTAPISPPPIGLGDKSSINSPIPNSRDAAVALSKPEINLKNISSLPSIAAPRWFNLASNFLKSSGSFVLNGLGFAGASLAFLFYFVFNFKIGSVIFGLPSLMSFLLAFQLKQTQKDSGTNVILDPLKGLRKIIYEEGLNQDQDRTVILRYIQDARRLLNHETRAEETLQALKAFNKMVNSKIDEIKILESSEQDKDLIEFKKDLEMYEEALDEIDLDGDDELLTNIN